MFTRIFEQITSDSVNLTTAIIALVVAAAALVYIVLAPRMFLLGVKNLRRNLLRTSLTGAAIGVLAFMITMIWTIIYFIELTTVERSKDLKIIVTYKWSVPSLLPMTHGDYLNPASSAFLKELRDPANNEPMYGPKDFMLWSFYGGSTDPAKVTQDSMIFFFVMEPDQIITMMDDLSDYDPEIIKKLKEKPQGCLLGTDKLKSLNKQVGERFKLTSLNYKGIDLEFEIVGVLPDGRYNSSAIMRMDYFNNSFDQYERSKGSAHPLAEKRLNLIWIRVGDREKFEKVGNIIEDATVFSRYPVKVETASSLVGSFLEAYRDIFLAMKFLVVPCILVIMSLVMANAISITVRERRTEMAVMKVLGYSPNQIMFLILGEAILVGAVAGFVAAGVTFAFFNLRWGGIPFRIGFFPVFRIPEAAMFWGLAIGTFTAFFGSFVPAWTARSVKVSEVFSKVT